MKFKEHDKVTVKISQTDSVTGEIVHVGELSKHYYISAGQHSGYYEEHELSALYPLQQGVTYFNVEPEKAATGSLRFNTGKVQLREVDPDFILGIGEVLTKSREKYPAFNWCKDTAFSVPYESMMRHLMSFQKGDDFDSESGKHHLLHVATNVMFLYYQYLNHPEMDDRGFKTRDKK